MSKNDDMLRGLAFLHPNIGDSKYGVVELCVIAPNGGNGGCVWEGFATGKGIVSGWFDNDKKLVSCVSDIEQGWVDRGGSRKFAKGVYITLNPCDSAILGRANNRLIAGQPRTSDKDIRSFSNILVDIDAIRPAGVSASDAEKRLSEKTARAVADYLVNDCLWPEPMICDSGNGFHLVFKTAIAARPSETAAKIKALLGALNTKFASTGIDDDGHEIKVVVDTSVFNPSRLVKLWGTWTRKGDATKDRPHRISSIIHVPKPHLAGPLTEHGLDAALSILDADRATNQENVARNRGEDTKNTALFQPVNQKTPDKTHLDVGAYLDHYGVETMGKKECVGTDGDKYTLWVLQECLFDASHDGNEAAIGQFEDGKLFYQCFHQSCKSDPNRRWKDVRKLISGDDSTRAFIVDLEGNPVSDTQFDDLTRLKFPRVNDKGKPTKIYANFAALADHYGLEIKYNLMAKRADVRLPEDLWGDSERLLSLFRAYVVDLCSQNGLTAEKIVDDWLNIRSAEHEYHPVKDWIESKKWDGASRFGELAETVSTGTPEAWRTYLRKWLVQAVAAVYERRFSCRGVLSFVGAQGIGKTSWFKSLVPASLGAFGEGLSLDPNNKDSIITALSKWIVELGEVDATFRRADVSRLKAFLTKSEDEIRAPYGRTYDQFTRRTVFASTVNEVHFLVDQTGNTRWWVIEAEKINWRHSIDMQQVWAEVLTWYQAGETWFLDEAETDMLKRLNTSFEQEDPTSDALLSMYQFDTPPEKWIHKKRAMDVAKDIGLDSKDLKNTRAIGNALRRLGCNQDNVVINGVKGRYYSLPLIRSEYFTEIRNTNPEEWLANSDKAVVKQ